MYFQRSVMGATTARPPTGRRTPSPSRIAASSHGTNAAPTSRTASCGSCGSGYSRLLLRVPRHERHGHCERDPAASEVVDQGGHFCRERVGLVERLRDARFGLLADRVDERHYDSFRRNTPLSIST